MQRHDKFNSFLLSVDCDLYPKCLILHFPLKCGNLLTFPLLFKPPY